MTPAPVPATTTENEIADHALTGAGIRFDTPEDFRTAEECVRRAIRIATGAGGPNAKTVATGIVRGVGDKQITIDWRTLDGIRVGQEVKVVDVGDCPSEAGAGGGGR